MPHAKCLTAAASFVAIVSVSTAGRAAGFTQLYSFANQPDGSYPNDGLVVVGGTLFGTTQNGGASNTGTVFKIDLSTGTETVLHSFGPLNKGAAYPESGLLSRAGKLYGTTFYGGGFGGAYGFGTLYKIDPSTGALFVLHRFNLGDGTNPQGRLVSRQGAIYGTSIPWPGGDPGYGAVFKFVPATGAESVVYSFSYSNTRSGLYPAGGLTSDASALYGLVLTGGATNTGGVFKIDLATSSERLIYSFAGGSDANYASMDGLILNAGTLYGTSTNGGAAKTGHGSVFKVDASTGAETVLHAFLTPKQGVSPHAGAVLHGGYLYGTTSDDGAYGFGTIYRVGARHGGLQKLYDFTSADGSPFAGLSYYGGVFYGSTYSGGTSRRGMVYKFVP